MSKYQRLADVEREIQWTKSDGFYAANGHVFFGRRSNSTFSLGETKLVVRDAADPEGLAVKLNAMIAEDKGRYIASLEAELAAA
jgi:hypothetical protein